MLDAIARIFNELVPTPEPEPIMLEPELTFQDKIKAVINSLIGSSPSMDMDKVEKMPITLGETTPQHLPLVNFIAGATCVASLGFATAGVVAIKNNYPKTAIALLATSAIATLATTTFAGYQAYRSYVA